jgi:halocyanin-like protein
MTSFDSDRRDILKAGGVALTAGLAGCSGILADGQGVPGKTGQKTPTEDGSGGNGNGNGTGVPPEVEQYLSDANNYDGLVDMTGESEVTVEVGAGDTGLAFGPAAVQVDPGTTIIWEWTGEGGSHNVIDEDGGFESELVGEAGHTFEQQFDEEGTTTYYCQPHKPSGMKGAIVVGSVGGGGDDGGPPAKVEDYLSDANNYDGVVDMTGESEVMVEVGAGDTGLAFGPAAVQVDPGTTIIWEWTGEGGSHNVVDEAGNFESELVGEAGHTFEHQFDSEGVVQYYCQPHKPSGMKGAIVVGSTGGGDSGGTPTEVEDYLSDANNYESIEDMTGESEVMVEVGAGDTGLAFGPAAVRIDSGTTVVWEWTGEGGSHNVVDEAGNFESELVGEAGHTFEHQFEESGVVQYYCQPHKPAGMKGAIVVE